MDRLPSIVEAAEGLRNGRVGPVDLVDACLAQIERREPEVHAWVRVEGDAARRHAADQQDRLAAGTELGPLQGIPVGIKDIIDVAGWPTEAGSPLLAGNAADEDAPVVARLRRAGAILLGKTATTEFAYLDPAATRNPWNPLHTPGGSSSGSAAAVAAGMCAAALGSQTGGSIIRPASYCGIAGLKPSQGLVDLRGVVPLSRHLDHAGPLARRVADLRILLQAMAGIELPAAPLAKPPTLYVIRDFFFEHADNAVRGLTMAALTRLQQAGAELKPLALPPSFRNLHAMHRTIMAVEAAENHFASFAQQPDAYRPHITALIEEGLSTLAIDYSLALRHQELFRDEIQQTLGETIAVTPSTVTPAPVGLESTGDPAFNSPWTYAGVPAVTIPCGLAPGRLPCGLQLVAARGQDAMVLDAAQWCERLLSAAF